MMYTIDSKIYVTPNGVYLTILKLHLILPVANLLSHNNSNLFCGQNSLQSAAVNCSFSHNLTRLGVAFILLAMEHGTSNLFKLVKL